jgi:hypothetical protein
MKHTGKPTRYMIGSDGCYERPTAFTYYLKSYRLRDNLAIKAQSRSAMQSMLDWLNSSKEQMEDKSDSCNIPLPRRVLVQFENEIKEINISDG